MIDPRPRLDRDRRRRLLRGRPVPRGYRGHGLHRQRRHQPDQPRPARVARLVAQGRSTQPDFVWSEDNWFRPVDIELGPDGALYVADFYNRIIGHYEVPLTHPGRDRERGRIWRIVYRVPMARADADRPGPTGPRRRVDGAGRRPRPPQPGRPHSRGEPVGRARRRASTPRWRGSWPSSSEDNPWRRVHALWVLHRLGAWTRSTLDAGGRATPTGSCGSTRCACSAEQPSPSGRSLVELARRAARRTATRSSAARRRGAGPASRFEQHPAAARPPSIGPGRRHAPDPRRHAWRCGTSSARHRPGAARGARAERARRRAISPTWPPASRRRGGAFLLAAHVDGAPEPRGDLIRFVHHIARYRRRGDGPVAHRIRPGPCAAGAGPSRHGCSKAIQQGTQERGASARAMSCGTWPGDCPGPARLGDGGGGPARDRPGRARSTCATSRAEPGGPGAGARRPARPSGPRRSTALVTHRPEGGRSPLLGRVLGDATAPAGACATGSASLARRDRPARGAASR